MRIIRFDPSRELRRTMWAGFPFADDWGEFEAEGVLSVDAYETDKEVVVEADLPGVDPNNVDITVTADSVTIKAERREEKEVKNRDYIRRERQVGTYARTLSLPAQVIADKAEAEFKDGTLVLCIPKEKQVQPQKVQVKVSKKEK